MVGMPVCEHSVNHTQRFGFASLQPCSPSSRPGVRSSAPVQPHVSATPHVGLTVWHLSEVLPHLGLIVWHLFEVRSHTTTRCHTINRQHLEELPMRTVSTSEVPMRTVSTSEAPIRTGSTSKRCHMVSPTGGEAETWGMTDADDLTPGLEEGEHGYLWVQILPR